MPVDYNIELRNAYLRAAQAAQEEEEGAVQIYRDFYEGDHDVLLTDRQKEYLRQDVDSFANLCKRVVNIPKNRLEITKDGILPADEASTAYATEATKWWNASQLASKQKDLYEAALRDGQVALIVGWDEASRTPTFTPNLIYDGATGLVRFHYDSDDNLIFASKRWKVWNPLTLGETGKQRLTVYRPGVIDRFEADSGNAFGWRFLTPPEINGLPNPQPWTDTGTLAGEPLGIPVIPFEPVGGSELKDVITIQELLNHSLGTFDISVDMHAFPLLWFTNATFPINSSTGKSDIPDFGPGQAINLGDNGTAGRIEPADLKRMYESGIMSWVQILALVKGWPMFLLDRTQQAPSGIALEIMEGSLVKQVEDLQVLFSGSWAKAFDVARKINRQQGGGELAGELTFKWESAKTADATAEMERLKLKFEAGEVPVIQRWRELGYTDDEITQMMMDKQREDEFGLILEGVTQ